ncbi:MAG TPA: hypothetical protein VG013_26550, partial [Gemmataceae bacterium]|nr:hypothetical protein [Gemmataceae bacterium]
MKRVVLIVAALALHMGGVGQASADYMQTVLADNPAGYWRLGEASGTTASDSSGNGHNGTYMGGVTLGQPGAIAGDPNTSVAFNGTNGIVDTSFVPNVLSFTIEAWVNPATASARPQTVAGVSGAAQLQYDYIFAGHPDIEFWDGASFRRAWTTSALPLNIWSDVVG